MRLEKKEKINRWVDGDFEFGEKFRRSCGKRPDLCEKLRGIFGMFNEIFGNLGRRAI